MLEPERGFVTCVDWRREPKLKTSQVKSSQVKSSQVKSKVRQNCIKVRYFGVNRGQDPRTDTQRAQHTTARKIVRYFCIILFHEIHRYSYCSGLIEGKSAGGVLKVFSLTIVCFSRASMRLAKIMENSVRDM